jgi:Xaa-Pro dipeptidase
MMSIPASEFNERIKKVQAAMRRESYAALVLYFTPDVRYLSNYTPFPDTVDAIVVAKTEGEPTLLIDQEWDLERARDISSIPDTRADSDLGKAAAETLTRNDFRGKLGIAGWSRFPIPIYMSLTKRIPAAQLEDASAMMQNIRMGKSSSEIDLLKRAAKITDAGAQAATDAIRMGKSEFEIAVAAENAMKEDGSEGLSFTTVVGSGPRTNLIVPLPTTRKPRKGEFVLMDLGGMCEGYHGDISRTKHVGGISPAQKDLFEAVSQMHAEARKAVKPGKRAFEIHEIARKVAKEAGYGDLPSNMTGHSLGLEEHERPILETEKRKLEPGMVVTIEPGLYAPRIGGVRIEDTVLVTETGHKLLTHYDRNF